MTREERDARYEKYLREHPGRDPEILSYESLLDHARGRLVRVLGGFSGLGYADPGAVQKRVRTLVSESGDHGLYVIGGTKVGIGEAYEWIRDAARTNGFSDVRTAGIVSREAAVYPDGIARQDYLVFVDTEPGDWQARRDGVSLMVDFAARTSGEMIYFKGGSISGAEIEEALERGVKVTVHAGGDIRPDPARLEKKRSQDPSYVADGTERILAAHAKRSYPSLTVLDGPAAS